MAILDSQCKGIQCSIKGTPALIVVASVQVMRAISMVDEYA